MKRIGTIENYYGGLYVKEVENKYYWTIEDYFGDKWEEISEMLYKELLKHETIKCR